MPASDLDAGALARLAPGLRQGVPLAPLTTWKVGGPADFFWEADQERLPEVLCWCREHGAPVWFLGRGSNVLIDDAGLRGLVVSSRKNMKGMRFDGEVIHAEAGVTMPQLSKFAAGLGWGGYEYLIGIPGSVGAGIAINAGLTAKGRKEIGDVLMDAEVMDRQGRIFQQTGEQLGLGYRSSNAGERELFILSARFKPTYRATAREIKHRTAEHLADRRRKQPLTKPTAGSTFKQPEGGRAAGWYIDTAGLKGHRIGGAKVSELHANWIENCGGATSADIRTLMDAIIQKVDSVHGIRLELEVGFLG